jgi:signal transduction histidine kinase
MELIALSGIALLTAILVSRAVGTATIQWAVTEAYSGTKYEDKTEEVLKDLDQFIEKHKVTEQNIELLVAWVQRQRDVYVTFYRDIDPILGPYMAPDSPKTDSWEDDEAENPDEIDSVELYPTSNYHDVMLYDGTVIKVDLEVYLDVDNLYWADIAEYGSGAIVFILLLFALIHRKIRYVNQLEQDLKVLGGGNLEYPITIKGRDELTSLAAGIEALKNGILEEQQMKAEAEKANMELVTAMSHDLRTPLTSLIGYLELLNMHRYEDEEQLKKYLEYCRKKAFQMKKVSDRLFEYFLVYGREEKGLQLQKIPSVELAEDLCNGQFFDWQDHGGTIRCQIGNLEGFVQVDSEYMQRVMDNLISNLKKYGDPQFPLEIEAKEQLDMLHIQVTNHIRDRKDHPESTQIGLKTCRKIMENHGGSFTWKQEKDEFMITIMFPLVKA